MAQDFTVDRNSPKWVLGADGYLKEYANDEAAIEFNADGSYKGVLVESQSINLCLQSEDINTTWTANSNATPTQSTETTPDGDSTNKYIKLIDDSGTGIGSVYVQQTITVLANTKYTASVFLKADQLDYGALWINNYDGTTDGYQFFELSGSGSLGTATNLDDSKIEAYPNGWYRCSVTWTQGGADTSFDLRIYAVGSLTSFNVDLDGTSSIFVWGAQVEASPIATSYIPTTTGAVTRVADDIDLTGASSLIGQTSGTVYVEAIIRKLENNFVVSISDGSSLAEAIYLQVASISTNLNCLIRTGGSITTLSIANANWTAGLNKIAYTYEAGTDNSALFLNGASPITGTSANIPTCNKIVLGARPDVAGGLSLNGWIRAVALFTTRLSDAEAYSLTGYDTYAQMANALQYTIL